MEKDFAGKNGYIWWTGVIVDRKDPANVGRCKVRIIGWHDTNENKVPVKNLPWAQVLLPVNNSKTIALPKEGEWVSGFFLDGMNGQMPVIVGVFPGILTNPPRQVTSDTEQLKVLEAQLVVEKQKLVELKKNYQTTTRANMVQKQQQIVTALEKQIAKLKSNLNKKPGIPWQDERKQSEVNGDPTTPSGIVFYQQGEPTIPRIGRGVLDGTIIDKTNSDRKHVCDITGQLVPVVLYLKTKYGIIATKIRELVRELLKKLGWDPSGESSALISFLKKVTNFLIAVSDMLEEIIDWKDLLIDVAAAAKEMIDYIMSLPERLYNLFKKCLKSLYKQLYAAFKLITDIGKDDIPSDNKELEQAWKEVKLMGEIVKNQTKELINTPQELVDTLTKPTSAETIAEIDAFILESLPSESEITGSAGFDKTKTERP